MDDVLISKCSYNVVYEKYRQSVLQAFRLIQAEHVLDIEVSFTLHK